MRRRAAPAGRRRCWRTFLIRRAGRGAARASSALERRRRPQGRTARRFLRDRGRLAAARLKLACRLRRRPTSPAQRARLAHRRASCALDELLWTFADGSFVPHEALRCRRGSAGPAERGPCPPATSTSSSIWRRAAALPAPDARVARSSTATRPPAAGRARFRPTASAACSPPHIIERIAPAIPDERPSLMDKTYAPHDIERRIYERWESHGWFAPVGRTPYCIMIPPPNVTGTLHMGHAFQHTLMDALTRYHRMRGDDTLWQPGTDHAGIATQMVVERQLNAAGPASAPTSAARPSSSASGSGRSSPAAPSPRQMRRLGDSVDWSRERFTMDAGLSRAVRRGLRAPVRGGPHLPRQAPGQLGPGAAARRSPTSRWRARRRTASSGTSAIRSRTAAGHVVVATTRPETMLGDAAVAVHPDDERYRHSDRQDAARCRSTDRAIPMIADAYVDRGFGTGVREDHAGARLQRLRVGQRHELPLINIFTPRRDAQRQRAGALPRPRPLRGAQARRRRARGAGPARARSRSTS